MRFLLPSLLRRRIGGIVLCAAVLGSLASWNSFAAADEIEDLRQGIPTGEVVRENVVRLSGERDAQLVALNEAERDLTDTLEARNRLDVHQRQLASEIEAATDHLQTVAVRTFVSGGSSGDLDLLVSVREVSDLSWRRSLLRNHTESSETALGRLEDLEQQATDEVRESIEAAARQRNRIEAIEADVDELGSRLAQERELEPLADAWDRAAIAIEQGSYGVAVPEAWEALRSCESTNNYRAVSSTGQFRGAYQFDFATWRTVGGVGDPAAAPAAEQDARARELYARRGSAPWPQCGFHLR